MTPAVLAELRAALASGATPGAALAAVEVEALAPVARAARLGTPLDELARRHADGDGPVDRLVRAMALAERTGAPASAAVERVAANLREQADARRVLHARTTQARGTARVLSAIPVLAWVLLIGLDPHALRFFATGLGVLCATAAVVLWATGRWWAGAIVRRAGEAPGRSDPLRTAPQGVAPGRVVALALPATVVGVVLAGPGIGMVAGIAAGAVALRRPGPSVPAGEGGETAETTDLLATTLAAGLPAGAAVGALAGFAPPIARPLLARAARRLEHGWAPGDAFAETGLDELGAVLEACHRWGAPASGALHDLAADLRARERAATEAAAERSQLLLVFPTTLLLVPAFGLATVPPLLWTSLAG